MIRVVKADGSIENFDENKVLQSAERAGIAKDIRQDVLHHVESKLYDEISTAEVYHHISEFLGKSPVPYAKSRYSLKQAIMALGPTGYPFEDFIAKILTSLGYTTKVRQILRGRCITHEIDVIAHKNGKTSLIEAKFHNNAGTRSQVHVPMYTKSRFDDVKERYGLDDAWVVTNTKTTTDANTFAQCVGMRVISWSYPDKAGLRDLIEESGLHPITMLTSLTTSQKMKLLEAHITLCKELAANKSFFSRLNMTEEQHKRALSELDFICKNDSTPKMHSPVLEMSSDLQPLVG